MFVQAYLQAAAEAIGSYRGEVPFADFLKTFFRARPHLGSRDRKSISHLCFVYFRLGHALPGLSVPDRMVAGLFLCAETPGPLLERLAPHWNGEAAASLARKTELLNQIHSFDPLSIFPFEDALSPQIEAEAFSRSFLQQPLTYLRVRPGRAGAVDGALEKGGIPILFGQGDLRTLPPAVRLEGLFEPDRDAVIQDISSQQVLEDLEGFWERGEQTKAEAWDCCAASGGKSILLVDRFPGIRLTASDIRSSILINLRKRFARAGIHQYRSFVADLAGGEEVPAGPFDLVLCDAPCSGSGTWARTPEQLLFFRREKIEYYARLQRQIAQRGLGKVKRGGYFLYITCSVFREENEAVVDHLKEGTGCQHLHSRYHGAYRERGDTLFTALFRTL